MKRRRIILGGIPAILAVGGITSLFWKPSNHGILGDVAHVDLEHVLACATLSNSAYHEPETIRGEFGSHVEIRDFPGTEIRVVFDGNPEGDQQWVAIRGTANLANLYTDMDFIEREDHELGIRVHRGFDAAFRECLPWVMERFDPDRPLCLTGHSLGGAVAILIAAVLERRGIEDVSVVTFGQPKLTDAHGAAALDHLDVLRAVYDDDPVPLVPPVDVALSHPHRYHHFGAELLLEADGTYYYLAAHDPDRFDVSEFWENIAHLRPGTHYMHVSYLPSLEAATKQAMVLRR